MEHANQEELSRWVADLTTALNPPAGWKPDTVAARSRFRSRIATQPVRTPWQGWLRWTAATAVAIAVVLLIPAGRSAAQQFWQYLTVRRVAFIRVNPWPEGVRSPAVKLEGRVIPPIPARDVDEARRRVNYDPRLPHFGVLSSGPRLSTTFSLSAGTVIHVVDLELALRKAGVGDQTVPAQWDSAHVAVHTSDIVLAEWPEVVLVQSLPLTLTAPADFDFPAFSTLVLRILGVGPDEAQRLARRTGTAPPWLAPIDRNYDASARLEEIQLKSGPATLVQQMGNGGAAARTTVSWSVPDRVYLLSGTLSRELAIAVANAVE